MVVRGEEEIVSSLWFGEKFFPLHGNDDDEISDLGGIKVVVRAKWSVSGGTLGNFVIRHSRWCEIFNGSKRLWKKGKEKARKREFLVKWCCNKCKMLPFNIDCNASTEWKWRSKNMAASICYPSDDSRFNLFHTFPFICRRSLARAIFFLIIN